MRTLYTIAVYVDEHDGQIKAQGHQDPCSCAELVKALELIHTHAALKADAHGLILFERVLASSK